MTDYPNLSSYEDYMALAKDVFKNPGKIIYEPNSSDLLYIKGNDLLRVKENGEFVSLYPGANSNLVQNALEQGGLIWPQ